MNSFADINSFLGIMQATIAPSMIISGLAFLLSIMAGRYARCIDRTRELLNVLSGEGTEKMTPKKRKAALHQLRLNYKRCRQLRNMMALAATSVFFVVITISCIFMGLLFNWRIETLAALLFISSLVFLCVAMGQFVRDIVISLYGIKLEIKDVEAEFVV